MKTQSDKVFVWPLCTRIIHWIIALSFLFSLLTSFFHHLYTWHIAFGFIFGIVLLFRLIWGFVGPNYATFKTFQLNLHELKTYFSEKVNNRWREIHAGHNAASSWFTIIVLFLGTIIVWSGLLLQGVQEGSGLLSFLNATHFRHASYLSIIHQATSYLLLAWAIVHIVGVLVEQFYHKTDMFFAMVTGYKKAKGKDAEVSTIRHLFSYSAIFISAIFFILITTNSDFFLTKSNFEKIDFKAQNPLFYDKCAACHKIYPPYMLPNDSWVRLMEGLDNHFGEIITDKNITKSEQSTILAYLQENSAEHSTRKIAVKTLNSLGDMRPISMTKVPYWREAHSDISHATFKSPPIKNASNCFVCHIDFEYGVIDNAHIKIP